VDEAAKVTERLQRIEALDRDLGSRPRLLDELRAVVGEAEALARADGGEGVEAALLDFGGRRKE
jgi:hypothetical protein